MGVSPAVFIEVKNVSSPSEYFAINYYHTELIAAPQVIPVPNPGDLLNCLSFMQIMHKQLFSWIPKYSSRTWCRHANFYKEFLLFHLHVKNVYKCRIRPFGWKLPYLSHNSKLFYISLPITDMEISVFLKVWKFTITTKCKTARRNLFYRYQLHTIPALDAI